MRLGLLAVALVLGGLGGMRIAQARPDVDAVAGAPFGVAKVTVAVPAAATDTPGSAALALDDSEGRTLYPAFSAGVLRRLLGELTGNESRATGEATAWFLFRGDKPFRVTFYTPLPVSVLVEPRPAGLGREHERLMAQWWREYNALARQQEKIGDYPPLVETYLTSMLSRRLKLELPPASRPSETPAADQLTQTVELLAGTERLESEAIRQLMKGPAPRQGEAALPAPPDIAWQKAEFPPGAAAGEIEPIALHVPEECFYVRFGRFSNFLWLNHLLQENGGDLGRLITLRGLDSALNARVEHQLALKESALAELLGEQVIADVALVGRDTYLHDGAAVGMLFQARASALLGADFNRQRAEALNAEKKNGATLVTEEIAGRKVSLLSTSDNRLRSFYAVDGDYHLITTSRAIVERFFAAGGGERSLGGSREFAHARARMPIDQKHLIFAYFSTAFLRGLVSPQYQIERQRRLSAVVEMELYDLARLAAQNEGLKEPRLADMIMAGMLPTGFGRRPDGSRLEEDGERVVDSLRGRRGTFVPIPDVPLRGVTSEEAAGYAQRSAFYAREFKQMDPLLVGVRRYALGQGGKPLGGREHLVIDAQVSPFSPGKYGWLTSMLGPPTRTKVAALPGDVMHLDAYTQGGLFDPNVPPHHLFLGVRDLAPLGELTGGGLMNTLRVLRSTPGYLGSWPKTGFIDKLPLGLSGSRPDANGFSKLPFGVWRRQVGDFSVVSFDLDLLARATAGLRIEESETPAQVWLHIADLGESKTASWVNSLAYVRARQASEGNVRLLSLLTQQFRVPPKDALDVAEHVLDAKLVCSLGGTYRLRTVSGGLGYWVSDRWTTPAGAEGYRPPPQYRAPLLDWFRGLDAELAMLGDVLVAHCEIDVARRPDEKPPAELPLFNFLGGKSSKPTEGKPSDDKSKPASADKEPAKTPGKGKDF